MPREKRKVKNGVKQRSHARSMSVASKQAAVVLGDGPLGDDATVEKDVMVRVRDGVRLACDVYRPKASGKYPVLLAVSPLLRMRFTSQRERCIAIVKPAISRAG